MKARLPSQFQNKAPGDMNAMIKQAQKMQEDIQAAQEAVEAKDFTVTAGGGAIELTMTGKKELKSVSISREVLDSVAAEGPDDLYDIIIAGVNAVVAEVDRNITEAVDGATNGVHFPGLV